MTESVACMVQCRRFQMLFTHSDVAAGLCGCRRATVATVPRLNWLLVIVPLGPAPRPQYSIIHGRIIVYYL